MSLSREHPGTIHLILTDVVMPGMSGRETAELVQAARPEIKVIYMSGHTENAIVHHGVLKAGIAFMQKPFRHEALLTKIRQELAAPSPGPGPVPGNPPARSLALNGGRT